MTRLLLLLLLVLPLSGRAQNLSTTTCTATVKTGCVELPLYLYATTRSVVVQATGTWTGALVSEGSNDGTTYVQLRNIPVGGGVSPATITANGVWSVPTAGLLYFRLRAVTLASGVAVVTAQPSVADAVDTGTVELGPTTAAALAAPMCGVSPTPPVVTLTTTPQTVPASPLVNRTQLVVRNLSSTRNLWCCVGAGCTPTSTAAYVVLPNGDHLDLPVRSTDTVRCRADGATADVNLLESACG